MESFLAKRDRIGVQDFVLLEDFRSETSFLDNLRKRFKEGLIYVSSIVGIVVYRRESSYPTQHLSPCTSPLRIHDSDDE